MDAVSLPTPSLPRNRCVPPLPHCQTPKPQLQKEFFSSAAGWIVIWKSHSKKTVHRSLYGCARARGGVFKTFKLPAQNSEFTRDGEVPSQKEQSSYFEELFSIKVPYQKELSSSNEELFPNPGIYYDMYVTNHGRWIYPEKLGSVL